MTLSSIWGGQAVREEQKAYHLQGAIEDILDDPNAVDLDEDGEEQALPPLPLIYM